MEVRSVEIPVASTWVFRSGFFEIHRRERIPFPTDEVYAFGMGGVGEEEGF